MIRRSTRVFAAGRKAAGGPAGIIRAYRAAKQRLFRQVATPLLAGLRLGTGQIGSRLWPDRYILVILAVTLLAIAPLIPRSTDNALTLASFINDEPALSMNLHAMTIWPIGNPANLDGANPHRPRPPGPDWHGLSYTGFNYYGGFYLAIGFAAYAPLKLAGAPIFPTAPLILRTVSFMAAIGSLLLIYGYAREHFSKAAGLGAAATLATDTHFLYYASIIHPDTLQLFMGLVCLIMAAVHVREKSWASLIALGLALGLSQGTKIGAIWFLPSATLAVAWGLTETSVSKRTVVEFANRYWVLGIVSILAWFASTPYAVLGNYFQMMSSTWSLVNAKDLGAGGVSNWLSAFYQHFGATLSIVLAGGFFWGIFRAATGKLTKPQSLALCLAASQFLWFATTSNVWVILGYCMLAYSILAIFAVDALVHFVRFLSTSNFPRPARLATTGAIAIVLTWHMTDRVFASTSYILGQHLRTNSTVVELDRWARKAGIPREARIIWDDIAYLDPEKFPNATMHGGLLTWNAIRYIEPDYVILSSSIYHSAWYAKLISEQNRTREDNYVYNVRLYQDFLGRRGPVGDSGNAQEDIKPALPWIHLIHTVRPTPTPQFKPPTWLSGFLQIPLASDFLYKEVRKKLIWLHNLGTQWSNIIGDRFDLQGVELSVFQFSPANAQCGREHAESLGPHAAANKPIFAFDGLPSYWLGKNTGTEAVGTGTMMDYGCDTKVGGKFLRVEWATPETRPESFRVEVSDNARIWRTVGEFKYDDSDGKPLSDTYVLARQEKGRFWRLVATSVDPGAYFAVKNIIIAPVLEP